MLSSLLKSIAPGIPAKEKLTETSSVPRPAYVEQASLVPAVSHIAPPGKTQWYPPVMIGAETLSARLLAGGYIEAALRLMARLVPDDYTAFLTAFYDDGLRRFGTQWRYADIITVLLCLAECLKPRNYLEIGVRRGRSVAAVASVCPECTLTMLDMWVADYAGMPNPGPDFVRQELLRIGHSGEATFIDGDSSATLPAFFQTHPNASFDLVTVDGDHSYEGAARDLCNVLPRISVGGAIVFDDVCHPSHPELGGLWRDLVASDPRFSAFTYSDAGYGVGFAIRKY